MIILLVLLSLTCHWNLHWVLPHGCVWEQRELGVSFFGSNGDFRFRLLHVVVVTRFLHYANDTVTTMIVVVVDRVS